MTSHIFPREGQGVLTTIESKNAYRKMSYNKQRSQQQTSYSDQAVFEPHVLGFGHISPVWDSRLSEKWPTLFSKTWFKWYFELKRTSKCVVGEAYGYSSSYILNCGECDDLGWKFMLYFSINSRKKMELNKERFVKHWNEIHLSRRALPKGIESFRSTSYSKCTNR
jgi:hypothetical protein